jgi:hypothetical protein
MDAAGDFWAAGSLREGCLIDIQDIRVLKMRLGDYPAAFCRLVGLACEVENPVAQFTQDGSPFLAFQRDSVRP